MSQPSLGHAVRRNASAKLAVEAALRLGSLAVVALIARKLGAEGLGTQSLLVATSGLAAISGDFGTRVLALQAGQHPWTQEQLSGLRWTLAALASLVLLAWGCWQGTPGLFALAALVAWLSVATDGAGASAVAAGQPALEAWGTLLQRALWAVGAAIALFCVIALAGPEHLVEKGIAGVWAAQVVALIICLVWWHFFAPKVLGLRPRYDGPAWKAIFLAALPIALASALSMAAGRVPWIILEESAGKVQLGYYAAAYKMLELGMAVPSLAAVSAFPVLSQALKQDHAGARQAAGRLARLLCGLILPYAVAIAWRGQPILAVLFGKDFGPSEAALPALMLALVLAGLGFVQIYLLLAAGERWYYAQLTALTALVTTVAAWIWLPVAGLQAAAWIAVLQEVVALALGGWRLHRLGLGLPWLSLAWRASVTAAGASAAALALPGLLGGAAGLAVAFGLGWAVGLWAWTDLKQVLRRAPVAA